MTKIFPEDVNPGDLIEAKLINDIMHAIDDLNERVKDLESTGPVLGPVEIFEPNPSTTLRIGDELRIRGKNFGSPNDNMVVIANKVVVRTFEDGSNSELLIIKQIPFVQGISETPQLIPISVGNKNGYASNSFYLAQAEVIKPTGSLAVTLSESPEVDYLEAGNSYTFEYRIEAIVTKNETYTLLPEVDIGWDAKVVNDHGDPVSPQEIIIPKCEDINDPIVRYVNVEVTIPPGTSSNILGKLKLSVISKENPDELKGPSDESHLVVGAAPPQADMIRITLSSVFSPGDKNVNGEMLVPTTEAEVSCTFLANVPEAADYTVSQPNFPENPSNLWTAWRHSAESWYMAPNQPGMITIKVVAKPGAQAADMIIKVTSQKDSEIVGDKRQKVLPKP